MMKTNPIGIYVHIPFCKKKCAYCDFCSYDIFDDDDMQLYVEGICSELIKYKKQASIYVDTVFFGGGTPSILPVKLIDKILKTIKAVFILSENAEITIEVNPGCANKENFARYYALGINRISIGLQSIHDNELKNLGRIHSYEDFLNTYHYASDSKINNINIDLMYGIPGQTEESFRSTLDNVVMLEPEHLSVYSLILEEGTSLYQNKENLNIPDDDSVADMYYLCNDILSKNKYKHYEISNYAKEGYECRHNLKYWQSKEFIGVGLSAYSYFDNRRYGNSGSRTNIKDFKNYISLTSPELCYNEVLEKSKQADDYIMLALRTCYGVNYNDFINQFGFDFKSGREDLIKKYVINGLAIDDLNSFRLTDKGFFVSNTIISELIF